MAPKPSAAIRYTLMRLGIFAGCFFAIWGLVYFGVLPRGLGESNLLWVLVLAIVISAPLSFVLLRKQRDEMSAQIAPKIEGVRENAKSKLAANRGMEDGAQDA